MKSPLGHLWSGAQSFDQAAAMIQRLEPMQKVILTQH